jgi:hypothetical protein
MQKTGVAVWDEVEIAQKRCAAWRFPRRSIWVERVESEWHVLTQEEPESGKDARSGFVARAEKPRSEQWRHYLHKDGARLSPAPVLPDRPLVVKPDRSLTLLPGQNAIFFLELPLWFRLSTVGSRPSMIFEEPLNVLTRTWFGDPLTGELCYGLATRLHHALDSADVSACIAICPLTVTNDSDTDLPFEKICLHAENLSVFRGSRRLWSNSLTVVFKGADLATQIEIAQGAPGYEDGLVQVSAARLPASGWNIRRTFGMLKSFADF